MDLDLLSHEERFIISELKRLAADARLDVRDYEYAQTRAEQLGALHEAKQRLEQLNEQLLTASGRNLFSAVDTAQFSALIQVIISQLQ
jgi:multidrug efflux pump subunit AcrA (membrane-fusion protein)